MLYELYNGTSLIRTALGQKKVFLLVRCPDFSGCYVQISMDFKGSAVVKEAVVL